MPLNADADVIRLRTGEVVKGRPLPERSDEAYMVIEDFLSGATRTLSWRVVDERDRRRLHRKWDLSTPDLAPVKAHRIAIELRDGTFEDLRGLIVREDDTHYHLQRGGKELAVRKSMVVLVQPEDLDPRDIWNPAQLVERLLAELARNPNVDLTNPTRAQLYRIAAFAREVGAFEHARRYFAWCGSDAALKQLEEVDAVLRDFDALKAVGRIRLAVRHDAFRKARQLLDRFPEEHPAAGEAALRSLAAARRDADKERSAHFQLQAKIQLPKLFSKLIRTKVQEKDIRLSDVTDWSRRALPDLALAVLVERLRRWDDVTPEEARRFWNDRKRSTWRTASYDAGTFIVEPPTKAKPRVKPTRLEVPRLPTRDEWWEQADAQERASWVTAFFAENGGLFEVSDPPKYTPCTRCHGTGLQSRRLSTGGAVSFLCTRCGGGGRDKHVRFR